MYSSLRLVYVRHDLTASAVRLITAHIVELTLDTVKQSAYRFAVLSGNMALLFPEVEIPYTLEVSDMQEFMSRYRYEIHLNITVCLCHTCSSYT